LNGCVHREASRERGRKVEATASALAVADSIHRHLPRRSWPHRPRRTVERDGGIGVVLEFVRQCEALTPPTAAARAASRLGLGRRLDLFVRLGHAGVEELAQERRRRGDTAVTAEPQAEREEDGSAHDHCSGRTAAQ